MYYYDPYGPRPAGRYYRSEDYQEPVFADSECKDTVLAPELGDTVYEGFSPMDLLDIGTKSERDITLSGLPIIRQPIAISQVANATPSINAENIQNTQTLEQRTQLVPIDFQEKQVERGISDQIQEEEPEPKPETETNINPAQVEGEKEMIIVSKPTKVTERQSIEDQYSDVRVNSLFVDKSQTIDDGLEHPGYGASEDELAPTTTEGISTLPPPVQQNEDAGQDQNQEQGEGFYQYGGGQSIEQGAINESTPTSLTDQPTEEEERTEEQKKGSGFNWMLAIGGGALLLYFLMKGKSNKE